MKETILSIILAVTAMTGQAQPGNATAEKSILWEISKEGMSKKSYLLGTFHGGAKDMIDYQFLDSLPRYHEIMSYVDAVGTEFDFLDTKLLPNRRRRSPSSG